MSMRMMCRNLHMKIKDTHLFKAVFGDSLLGTGTIMIIPKRNTNRNHILKFFHKITTSYSPVLVMWLYAGSLFIEV